MWLWSKPISAHHQNVKRGGNGQTDTTITTESYALSSVHIHAHCTYMDTYIPTHIHTYIRTYLHTCHTCIHTHISIAHYTHIPTYLPTHLNTHIYTHIHAHIHIHTYLHTYILMYIHTYVTVHHETSHIFQNKKLSFWLNVIQFHCSFPKLFLPCLYLMPKKVMPV